MCAHIEKEIYMRDTTADSASGTLGPSFIFVLPFPRSQRVNELLVCQTCNHKGESCSHNYRLSANDRDLFPNFKGKKHTNNNAWHGWAQDPRGSMMKVYTFLFTVVIPPYACDSVVFVSALTVVVFSHTCLEKIASEWQLAVKVME